MSIYKVRILSIFIFLVISNIEAPFNNKDEALELLEKLESIDYGYKYLSTSKKYRKKGKYKLEHFFRIRAAKIHIQCAEAWQYLEDYDLAASEYQTAAKIYLGSNLEKSKILYQKAAHNYGIMGIIFLSKQKLNFAEDMLNLGKIMIAKKK